ncbi:hypothetical protein B0H19DRAFT_1085404 [Mycena capillaripes]|nr:hypothetical protein B0H19DRAFT_1085404 [Mycena capillaripes]
MKKTSCEKKECGTTIIRIKRGHNGGTLASGRQQSTCNTNDQMNSNINIEDGSEDVQLCIEVLVLQAPAVTTGTVAEREGTYSTLDPVVRGRGGARVLLYLVRNTIWRKSAGRFDKVNVESALEEEPIGNNQDAMLLSEAQNLRTSHDSRLEQA